MKKHAYTPDAFMNLLYDTLSHKPYENVDSYEEALNTGIDIRRKARALFAIDKIISDYATPELTPDGTALDYPDYTLNKYSLKISEKLYCPVLIIIPKGVTNKTNGVVALCGHGYGVRQIAGISKNGRKKLIPYVDNYQKSFAVELVKRGNVVIAPELFGFGEARLKKDLFKPFYISSCDELSHHLLPYGLTTAGIRIAEALTCISVLKTMDCVNSDKISIMGISGGGLTALYASLLDESIYKTVISGYINTFKDSILSLWHCPDNYVPGILEIGEIYDFASALAPKKLFIESGTKDKLFPISGSEYAHSNIARIYKLMNAENNLIIDVFNGKHCVNGNLSFDWLSE